MPTVRVPVVPRKSLMDAAERRWEAIASARGELLPAVDLQRRLLTIVVHLAETIDARPLPRLSLPGKYLAAKLTRGVPAFAGEPIPLPVGLLTPTLVELCTQLGAGGAGDTAEHIRAAIENGGIEPASLLAA